MTTSIWQRLPYAPFLFIWYGVDVFLSLANYVAWLRFADDFIGSVLIDTYLAFVIIGTFMYLVPSATCFIWALRCQGKAARNKVLLGILFVWLFSDMPFFVIEIWINLEFGWYNQLQMLTFLVTAISWFIGALALWAGFMWRWAKICQRRVGDPLYPSSAIGHTAGVPPPAGVPPNQPMNVLVDARRRVDPLGEGAI